MAEKTLNTRIALKIGTLGEWQAGKYNKTEYLKKGELAIVTIGTDVETNHPVDNTKTHPILFKVGTGAHYFDDLPWASALAADVYDWAKAATKPSYTASEIDGLEEFIAGEIQDTDTTYTFEIANNDLLIKVFNKAGEQTDSKTLPIVSDAELVEILKGYQKAGSYKTTQTAVEDQITDAAHVLDSLTQNANGEISYTVKKLTPADIGAQPAGNYKTKQTATSESGSTIETVTNISQNENGEISVTYGNIAFPEDTNTAHTHSDGIGVKVTGDGGINGDVKIDLDIKFNPELVEKENIKYLQILDNTDNTVIAEFDTTEFIKDGMIKKVELVQEDASGNKGQFLKITWNTDGDVEADDVTYVNVSALVDVYTGVKGNDIEIAVSNKNEISATLTKTVTDNIAKGVTAKETIDNYGNIVTHNVAEFATAEQGTKADNADTYLTGVKAGTTEVPLASAAIQASDYISGGQISQQFGIVDMNKANKVQGATAGNFAGLDTNGNLTDSGKKAADFALAAKVGVLDPENTFIDANDTIANVAGNAYALAKQNGNEIAKLSTDKMNKLTMSSDEQAGEILVVTATGHADFSGKKVTDFAEAGHNHDDKYVMSVTEATNSGLKVDNTDAKNPKIAIDDSLTWIFDCGGAE